jgi:hypothetical protein
MKTRTQISTAPIQQTRPVSYDPANIPSLASFLAGTPERVITTQKPKIALTWLHTDEDHAPTVAHEIYRNHPLLAEHVNYICGNPHTAKHAPHKGFTHNDLNRNFKPETLANPQTYEEHRAVEVINFIEDADFVLDLHNTVCTNFGKVMVVKEAFLHEPQIQKIIAASPMKRILLMTPEVADLTLIGEGKARTVTLEYELAMTKTEAVPDAIQTIEALIEGNKHHRPFEREIFRMIGIIPKSEDPGLHVKNFEPFTGKDGQTHYAAFLGTGPRSYREDPSKNYCGYYATMERMVI